MTENSVTLHISGSIHMIVCVDTHVYNDHISRCSFHFFKIVIFDVAGSERAKNGPKWQKNLLISLCISQTMHHMIVIFGTHVLNDDQQFFLILYKFWGFRLLVGKSAKNDLELPISVHHTQYFKNGIISLRFLVDRCKIVVSPGVLLYFFKKRYVIVNIKILYVFYWPTSIVFFNIVIFQVHQ